MDTSKVNKLVLELLNNAWNDVNATGFGQDCYSTLKIVKLDVKGVSLDGEDDTAGGKGAQAVVVQEGEVVAAMCHRAKSMHGACTAYLIDICSSLPSLAVSSKERWRPYGGVTSSIDFHIIAGAPLGSRIRVISTLVNQTKQIAVMHCRIEDAKSGKVYATGFHTKVWGGYQAKNAKAKL